MKLRDVVSKYVPYNEQETKDKETILKYIDTFDDVLTRNNEFVHFTSSGFVVNKDRNKVLMIYHNIYDSWGWTGGHADGEEDLLEVALREVKEETGIKNVKPVTSDAISLDTLAVLGHMKKGKYVSAHVHLSLAYLIEADDNEELVIKEDENSGVKWFPIDKVIDASKEPHMRPIYEKIINKIRQYDL